MPPSHDRSMIGAVATSIADLAPVGLVRSHSLFLGDRVFGGW